jgi:alpha-amylase
MSEHNAVMMQFFHWYTPGDGGFWTDVAGKAAALAAAGIDALWLPPASKGANGPADVGYGVYDLYDLGEFDQKGAVRTKYGTRAEYVAAIKALQAAGIRVYADIVLNHRLGSDGYETVRATPIPDRRPPHPKRRAGGDPGRDGVHLPRPGEGPFRLRVALAALRRVRLRPQPPRRPVRGVPV